MTSKPWEDRVIFKTVAGSHLYGTATPESDYDVRGVCHQTPESLIGLSPFDQYQAEKEDLTIFGLNKFCKLAADCNPNIIEILFAPTEAPTCLYSSRTWLRLLDIRHAFVSKKALYTFTGYAYSQLERIERHYRWIRDGAPVNPNPKDFGAEPIHSTDANNEWKWATPQDKNMYQNARERYRQWQHWMTERNPARHDLEQKWGYDTKNALHLARLMTQGEELITTGRLAFPRPDAKWLLEIRNGLMTYDEIVQWAKDAEERLKVIADNQSAIPHGPNRKLIEQFVMRINMEMLNG